MKAALDLYTDCPGLWRILLAKVFGLAVWLRLRLVNMGVIKSRSLPARVISVGNLVVGGTGKTPTVLYIARMLSDFPIENNVSISSSGTTQPSVFAAGLYLNLALPNCGQPLRTISTGSNDGHKIPSTNIETATAGSAGDESCD